MQNEDQVKYFVSTELGHKLPFAIVSYEELIQSDDIFTPSLRDFHVIFWVRQGTGTYVVDFQEHEFKPNSLILLSKDQLHYFHPFDRDETEIMSISFVPDFVYKSEEDLDHLFRFNANAHQVDRQTIQLDETAITGLDKLAVEMFSILNQWGDSYKATGFYHYLCLFLIQCEMIQARLGGENNLEMDEDVANFLRFNELLEQHYKTEFKVDFYANQLNMTAKSLTKLTKKHFKASPKTVIDQRRILEIKRQLKGTSKSGKTIAYELNFGEPTNLFKFFKKHVGMTPTEFKAQG